MQVNTNEAQSSLDNLSKEERKTRKKLIKQLKREGIHNPIAEADARLLKIRAAQNNTFSDTETTAVEQFGTSESECQIETEVVKTLPTPTVLSKDNTLLISTFICISHQINALTEQREALLPFIPADVVVQTLKRKRRLLSHSLVPVKKRKVTAYLLFFKDVKIRDPNISMKEAGTKWRELSPVEKDKYQAAAELQNKEIDEFPESAS